MHTGRHQCPRAVGGNTKWRGCLKTVWWFLKRRTKVGHPEQWKRISTGRHASECSQQLYPAIPTWKQPKYSPTEEGTDRSNMQTPRDKTQCRNGRFLSDRGIKPFMWNNVDGPGSPHPVKRPDTKDHVLGDFISMKCLEWENPWRLTSGRRKRGTGNNCWCVELFK